MQLVFCNSLINKVLRRYLGEWQVTRLSDSLVLFSLSWREFGVAWAHGGHTD